MVTAARVWTWKEPPYAQLYQRVRVHVVPLFICSPQSNLHHKKKTRSMSPSSRVSPSLPPLIRSKDLEPRLRPAHHDLRRHQRRVTPRPVPLVALPGHFRTDGHPAQ